MFEQGYILVLLKEYIEIVVIKTITLFKSSLIESRLWGRFGGLLSELVPVSVESLNQDCVLAESHFYREIVEMSHIF